MLVKKIYFYNNYHNGDIHYSSGIVRFLSKILKTNKYYFLHKNKKGLVTDMNIEEGDLNQYCDDQKTVQYLPADGSLYINTWIGQERRRFVDPMSEKGCCSDSNLELVKYILSLVKVNVPVSNKDIVPFINFENPIIDKEKISNSKGYLKVIDSDGYKLRILISNGNVMSGQANNIDLIPIIDSLSNRYNDILFVLTEKTSLSKDNIVYTDDITSGFPDLNEIGYISKMCEIIIGRASGPYCFTHIVENLNDSNKTFLSLNYFYKEGIWYNGDVECNYVNIPHPTVKNVIKITDEIINEKYKYG